MDFAEESRGAERKLPEVAYTFTSRGAPDARWRVVRMRLGEGLSRVYEATLDLACETAGTPDAILGERCVLTLARGGQVLRRLCGVVRQVEDLGMDRHDRLARVEIVPELWLLSQRVTSRIFQDLDAPDIVRAVLSAAGLYADALRADLFRSYRRRQYCVQYRETDLAFVQRLLEDEGITYTFDHDGDGEALVLVDDLARFPALAGADGPIPVAGDGLTMAPVETVRRLDLTRRLNPTGATLRDWDHENPSTLRAVLTRSSPVEPGPREIYDYPAEYALRDASLREGSTDYAARLAAVRAEERRAADRVAAGAGNVTGLAPGVVFSVAGHGRDDLNARYLVTGITHEGDALEEIRFRAGEAGARYGNRFTVVDAAGPWRPPRVTPRPQIHGAQTATVVGPASEEIHTDGEGRIQLLFHWDRERVGGEGCSCWVRVAQTWSGAGWGGQFIPRIGMEAVVTFLEGNPDRPLVTGCVYNGANPPPFAVPGDKTRSGVRTRSSVGGHGFNELSFEDRQGEEQVYVRAQRDLDEAVLRDHTLQVGRDEHIRVEGDQTEHVGAGRRDHVGVDEIADVGHDRRTTIGHDDALRVEGALHVDSLDTHLATRRHEVSVVGENARREVAGTAHELVKDDKTVRVHGNLTTIVGSHDARRTFVVHAEGRAVVESTTLTEISSEKELILRCGDSRIRLTPDRIELSSKAGLTLRSGNTVVEVTPDQARIRSKGKAVVSADSVNILTDSAQVKLTDEVKITGSMVRLNPPKTDTEKDDDPKPPKPTRLAFKDGQGRPLANQRFVIHLDDGAEVAGVLDGEGRAELELEGGGQAKVTFPEASEVEHG